MKILASLDCMVFFQNFKSIVSEKRSLKLQEATKTLILTAVQVKSNLRMV